VEAVPWKAFTDWWGDAWEPGDHVAILGQTHSGKTTLEGGLLAVRNFVLVLDAKGHDSSLSAFGYARTSAWPLPNKYKQDIKEGYPCHVIVGRKIMTEEDFERNAALLRRVVKDVFGQGKWTLVADEGQILADTRYVGAGASLEKLLIVARDRKVSIVFAVQRPSIGRTSPAASAAFSQATWLFATHTRDQKVQDRLAEIAGRPAPEFRALLNELPKYTWACFGLDPHEPIRIIQPPKLPDVPDQHDEESGFAKFIRT
jgi:hypothetical protein